MPRVHPKKRAALDILDWLLFNQTWFLHISHDDGADGALTEDASRQAVLIALVEVRRRVDEAVLSTGVTGVAAQALKHTVYCLLEAGLSDDLLQKSRNGSLERLDLNGDHCTMMTKPAEAIDPAQAARLHEYNQQFFMALIVAFAEEVHDVCMDSAIAIAERVRVALGNLPTAVKHRLVERVFILEFMNAPVKFLSWMYQIGVLSSKKFVPKRVKREISDDFKARVGLLCEFRLMRDFMARLCGCHSTNSVALRHLQSQLNDQLSDAAWSQLQEEYDFYMRLNRQQLHQPSTPTFNLGRLADNGYLHEFLELFAKNHWRSRFWTGSQHSLIGVIGAGMICGYHSLADSDRKITRNGNNYSKSDEPANEQDTVAELVCRNLDEHGLDCRPGSLYETYIDCYMKQPAGLYHRAMVYHALQQQLDVVFPAHFYDSAYMGVITASTP